MKKVKSSIVYRLVRYINLFLNEKASPTDEAKVLLALVNLENDTKYRLETVSAFNALFKAQMRKERHQRLYEICLIDQHIPKKVVVSDCVVKDPVFLSPIGKN
jgi:hypothetical protein